MTTSNCGCGCGSTPEPCAHGTQERPRYFPRQLITPVELTLEQQYFRDKLRRHNRLMHGWGVACGAQVCQVTDPTTGTLQPWMVTVQPGYVLGPYGDEILIGQPQAIDLRTAGTGGDLPQAGDPWCGQVPVARQAGPLYVAVSYQETMCRQVRVQPTGCGCDDSQCEYSRWRDGFEIGVLAQSPAAQQAAPGAADLFQGARPDCPPCPTGPWVVLAQVMVDANGLVGAIDNCTYRRLVASWGAFWWTCGEPDKRLPVTAIDTAQGAPTTSPGPPANTPPSPPSPPPPPPQTPPPPPAPPTDTPPPPPAQQGAPPSPAEPPNAPLPSPPAVAVAAPVSPPPAPTPAGEAPAAIVSAPVPIPAAAAAPPRDVSPPAAARRSTAQTPRGRRPQDK
jgi:hypothetical protein